MSEIKELLDLIDEEETTNDEIITELPEKTKSKHFKENKDVLAFIRKYNIKNSETNKVPTYLIYYLYKNWVRFNWYKLYGKEEFFRTFKRYFNQKRSGNQRFYTIEGNLDLSESTREKAKKYEKNWQKRKK